MIYYLISIAVLTLIFWALHRARIVPICPICAGVVITWISGIVALYFGTMWANPLIIAILMGASLGALADKYGTTYGLFWKSMVVIIGLPAIYFITQKSIWQSLVLLTILIVLTIVSKPKNNTLTHHKKDLFKDCC